MAELDHPNIVRYLGCTYEAAEAELRIFMEYVDGGSLAALVSRLEEPLNEDAARTYTAQVVAGVAYLHRRNIMHRDLKCANILLSSRGEAKLADFGTSKSVEQVEGPGGQELVRHISNVRLGAVKPANDAMNPSRSNLLTPTSFANITAMGGLRPPDQRPSAQAHRRMTAMVGTVLWMAPEVHRCALQKGDSYSYASDVWSLGCCLCEILNQGEAPWKGFAGNVDATVAIARWQGDLPNNVPRLHELSRDCAAFMKLCLAPDPSRRPAASVLERHPWLTRTGYVMEAAPQQALADIEEAMREDKEDLSPKSLPTGFAFSNDIPF